MFFISYECGGRLGNSLFPFFLCMLFERLFGYTYTEEESSTEICITDYGSSYFFTEESLLRKQMALPMGNICFTGFFQYGWIFKYNRKELLEYVQSRPCLITMGARNLQNYYPSEYLFRDWLPSVNPTPEDIVIHLRLEDNIVDTIQPNSPKFIFSPDDYDQILSTIQYKTIYWVMKAPEHPIEHKYIAYLLKKWGGIYQARTLEEDMCLMRKAHRIVLSRSTLSMISSYLTPHDNQVVYMPIKQEDWPHEQCVPIFPTTYFFPHTKCSLPDLERILGKE